MFVVRSAGQHDTGDLWAYLVVILTLSATWSPYVVIVSLKVFGTERVHSNMDLMSEMHQ